MCDVNEGIDLSNEVQQILASVQEQMKENPKFDPNPIAENFMMNSEFAREANQLLRNWAKVESESESIKQKITHSKPTPVSFLPSEKPIGKKNNIKKENPEDDFALAFGLLDKYRKNRNMINEEIREQNHKLDLIENTSKPQPKASLVDPALVIEMRHAKVEQKRKQRQKEKVLNPTNKTKENNIPPVKKVIQNPVKKQIPDPIFTKQLKEISEKRVTLENDSKKIAEIGRAHV